MAYYSCVKIEWDEDKNRANQIKHGVSFEAAASFLSSDVDYLELFDEAHSGDEERFIAIGPMGSGVVVIVWTERDDETVRIISARWATRRERAKYEALIEEKQ